VFFVVGTTPAMAEFFITKEAVMKAFAIEFEATGMTALARSVRQGNVCKQISPHPRNGVEMRVVQRKRAAVIRSSRNAM
jgi:phosphopantetheinyl transferase (holo-ACP synthase)